jgi:hypothetical protein
MADELKGVYLGKAQAFGVRVTWEIFRDISRNGGIENPNSESPFLPGE